ncbi:MAG: DUF1629 domain-containing protein [Pseudomonadota bacterium]
MVWGMILPRGFGDYWPDGDFEKDPKTGDNGWFRRLTNYYAEQTEEEQKRLFEYAVDPSLSAGKYGTYPVGKFKKEPDRTRDGSGKLPYGDVEPHEVPKSFDTDKSYKSLASLISLNSRLLAVDERLKTIIERLEPGMHEFFPFALMMPKGKPYPKQYYILRIRQYFDAFSKESTNVGSVQVIPAYDDVPELIEVVATKKALSGLAMRKEVFANAHLWRDRTFEEELTCFSDELIAEIQSEGLKLPKHYKLKVV